MSTQLVTGANRGIGLNLVQQIAKKPDTTVIATVRDESKAKPILDLNLPNVKVFYTDMGRTEDQILEDFKVLKDLAPNGIDVLVHNAAVNPANAFAPTLQQKSEDYAFAFNVNALGSFKLFKAIHPYLIENKSKLMFISSVVATNGDPFYGSSAYGTSKAALNHIIRQIARETSFITIAMHPGFVITDMSKEARDLGVLDDVLSAITTEESTSSMLAIVDKLTKEDNDKFYSYDGTMCPW